jgi:hypothetical protein
MTPAHEPAGRSMMVRMPVVTQREAMLQSPLLASLGRDVLAQVARLVMEHSYS